MRRIACSTWAAMVVVLLVGCTTDTGETDDGESGCRDTFSVSAGYGYGNNDPSAVAQECVAQGGLDCDAESFMTQDAAICRAQEEGLAEGLAPWSVSLVYHHSVNTAVWNVSNTLVQGTASASGHTMTFGAVSGELLQETDWVRQD